MICINKKAEKKSGRESLELESVHNGSKDMELFLCQHIAERR